MNSLTLAAMLCAKLCHDLVGPIGALNNGIEILADEEDPAQRAEASELLGASALEAARRLRFFRIAFGVAGSLGQAIDAGELRSAAEEYFAAGKVRLAWPRPSGGDAGRSLDKREAKLLLNLILLAAAALPRGGTIAVGLGTGTRRFEVRAEGAAIRFEAELATALVGGLDEALLDTHNVIACYAAAQARDLNGRIGLERPQETALVLAFATA